MSETLSWGQPDGEGGWLGEDDLDAAVEAAALLSPFALVEAARNTAEMHATESA